jgi:hypothetical protein
MIYETRDDILRAYLNWLEAHPGPVKGDEPELERFRYLLQVYHQAQLEPPEGVIGVGTITYAQQKLVEAQQ